MCPFCLSFLTLFSKAFIKPGRDPDCNSVSFLVSREYLAADTSIGRRHVENKAPNIATAAIRYCCLIVKPGLSMGWLYLQRE